MVSLSKCRCLKILMENIDIDSEIFAFQLSFQDRAIDAAQSSNNPLRMPYLGLA